MFEHGAFTDYDAVRTATVFLFYVPQLPLTGIDQVLIYAFYARRDTVTPVLVGVVRALEQIGVDTMRMQGHAQHDDARYVPKATLDEWAARDPLERFKGVLTARKAASEKDFADIDRMTREYAAKEADLAVDEPMPDPASVARGVYAGDDYAVPKVELVTSPFAQKGSSA